MFGSAFLIGIKFLIKFFLRLQFSSRAHKTLYSSLLPPFSPSFLPTLYSSLPSFIPPSLPCVSLSLPPFLPLFSLPSETWLRIHIYHYIHVHRTSCKDWACEIFVCVNTPRDAVQRCDIVIIAYSCSRHTHTYSRL